MLKTITTVLFVALLWLLPARPAAADEPIANLALATTADPGGWRFGTQFYYLGRYRETTFDVRAWLGIYVTPSHRPGDDRSANQPQTGPLVFGQGVGIHPVAYTKWPWFDFVPFGLELVAADTSSHLYMPFGAVFEELKHNRWAVRLIATPGVHFGEVPAGETLGRVIGPGLFLRPKTGLALELWRI